MSEKVVLPKFDIPGQGPHPAIRVLMASGILFAVALVALGGALWRHHSQQVAAEEHAQAILAARAAEAAAAVEAAKARAAEAVAKVAAAKAAAEQAKAAAALAKAGDGAGAATAEPGGHRSQRHHGKVAAKGGAAPGKVVAKSEGKRSGDKRDDAAIDKLLASFK
jgi:hypothetical protein